MRIRRVLLAPAALMLWASPAWSADLAKIDRRIAREPAYQTKAPRYCLLVFGPEAKTRVWLVQDGDVLYVDRNGDGDLTEKDKRVKLKQQDKGYREFEAVDIKDGSLTHTGLTVTQMVASQEGVNNDAEFQRIKSKNSEPWTWLISVTAERPPDDPRPLPKRIEYLVNGDGTGWLLFGDRPADAPIVHLNGPWTFALQDVKQRLHAGHFSMLQVGVGTPGIGPGVFAWVLYKDTIPSDAYPQAQFTFPTRNAGAKPIERTVTFKRRC
jgi:hypothetical protein